MFAAGVFFVGGFGQASAADWYYIDADADDAAWFIDNSSVYKTDDAATVLVKINNVEGFTYIYTVRIDRKEKTWTELDTTVYSNTRFVSATNKDNKRAANSTAANGDLDLDIQKSITSTLSAYDIDKKKDKTKVTSVKSDDLDAVTFRLALKPGVNNDKYRPEKIDADLVKDDEFQFETFFNKVFKETAIEKMEKDFAAKAEAKKQLQVSIQENEDRLRINEFDSEALQAKKANKDNLDKLELELSELAGTLREYQDLKYDSTMFANLNTKAVVFDVEAYKKRKG